MIISDSFTLIIYIISLVAVMAGSVTDFQRREVPDWINYGLIIVGLGIRLLFSIYHAEYTYIIDGILGLGLFYLLALGLFYTGQWGGGDSKMLMGLSAMLGLPFTLDYLRIFQSPMVTFVLNLMIIGGIYGVFWSGGLVLMNIRKFGKEFTQNLIKLKQVQYITWGLTALIIIAALFTKNMKIPLIVLGISIFALYYIWIGVKALEKVTMVKDIPIEKLTEGDWIVNDVVVDKKRICGPKDLGISKEQIHRLHKLKEKGKITHITVKEGIPFVPSFLLAFLYTIIWGNNIFLLIFQTISTNI
jgi:Flp pilus assembly protein protease CpaA